jgi:alkanesulfonate monooxygenase SsuD/methylene tetrahydromethanopterin reductase-like flavin-dependent oxidoreductase (luciferase family)
VLSTAVRDYALVGSVEEVRSQVEALREAGADHVVAYPARGIGDFLR